jgi:hypothetical protein
MKLWILILLISCCLDAKLVDLGFMGHSYEIKESDLLKDIKSAIDENDWEQEAIELQNSVKKMFNVKYSLPISTEDKNSTTIDYSTVSRDLYDIHGNVIYKAGSKVIVPIPKGQNFEYCFADAHRLDGLFEVIKRFGKKCVYLVANQDFRVVSHFFKGIKFYPMNDVMVKRFNIEYFPTKIRLYEDKIEHIRIDYKSILERLKVR